MVVQGETDSSGKRRERKECEGAPDLAREELDPRGVMAALLLSQEYHTAPTWAPADLAASEKWRRLCAWD